MFKQLTTLERAYQLARSGEFAGVGEIKARLKAERYQNIPTQLFGRRLAEDLRRLCVEARTNPRPLVCLPETALVDSLPLLRTVSR